MPTTGGKWPQALEGTLHLRDVCMFGQNALPSCCYCGTEHSIFSYPVNNGIGPRSDLGPVREMF